jgi:hypothetical protein
MILKIKFQAADLKIKNRLRLLQDLAAGLALRRGDLGPPTSKDMGASSQGNPEEDGPERG